MLPFLFAAFLLIEGLEHYSGKHSARIMEKSREGGACCGRGCRLRAAVRGFPLWRRICTQAGSFPWEPFWRLFLATSDEAVLILLGNPQYAPEVGRLLAVKVVIAIAGGYVADLCLKDRLSGKKEEGVLRVNCGCHADHAGILMPAWRHTFRLFPLSFSFYLDPGSVRGDLWHTGAFRISAGRYGIPASDRRGDRTDPQLRGFGDLNRALS